MRRRSSLEEPNADGTRRQALYSAYIHAVNPVEFQAPGVFMNIPEGSPVTEFPVISGAREA